MTVTKGTARSGPALQSSPRAGRGPGCAETALLSNCSENRTSNQLSGGGGERCIPAPRHAPQSPDHTEIPPQPAPAPRQTGAIPKKRRGAGGGSPLSLHPDEIIALPLDDLTPLPGINKYYNHAA